MLGLGIDESSDSALLSSFITSEYLSSAILISLSFSGGKLCNQAHAQVRDLVQVRDWVQDTRERDLEQRIYRSQFEDSNLYVTIKCTKTEFASHNLVHKTEFASHNLVHKSEFVSHNLVHKTEFVSHNLVHKTEFVSHNLVHKTEFVDNNLKFACEMEMEFHD